MPLVTLLSISVDDTEILNEYATRGLKASIEPIDASSSMERTANGELLDLSLPQFRKFQMEITCTDMESNGLAVYPPGTLCTVRSLPNLGVRSEDQDSDNVLVMQMRMGRWRENRDEAPAVTGWTLPLIEV